MASLFEAKVSPILSLYNQPLPELINVFYDDDDDVSASGLKIRLYSVYVNKRVS